MADRWKEERDRAWRKRHRRRAGDPGRGERATGRYVAEEDRSWGPPEDERGYRGPVRYREAYGEEESRFGGGRHGSAYRGMDRSGGRGGWQDRDYAGVSPAMEQGEYDAEREAERYYGRRGGYPSGGRYYGDSGRERIFREEYGQGGVEYGEAPPGYDAGRERWLERARRHFEEEYEGPFSSLGRSREYERGGREVAEFFRRLGDHVAAWFGEEVGPESAERYRERDFRGMGPKGYKRTDERINDEAHERLTDDSWLDASDISVSVAGGEVMLSGTVESREAKHRAEHIVEDIAGVGHVQNNLRVDRSRALIRPGDGSRGSVLERQTHGEIGSGEKLGGAG